MDYITREFHEEFARRIDAENERQNRRISLLEENRQQINSMTVFIEKMSVKMDNMLEEQKKQGERLEALEKEPVNSYKQIKMVIITAIITTIIGTGIGALLALILI